jgi:hypothetical protein
MTLEWLIASRVARKNANDTWSSRVLRVGVDIATARVAIVDTPSAPVRPNANGLADIAP